MSIFKNIIVALKGFAMGAANVIPGVSGGTIALLTGIFTELVDALDALMSVEAWRLLLKGKVREFWKHIHGTFLLWLLLGVVVSVFSLAKLMEYVLAQFPIQTWAFFFGLIIMSSVFLLSGIKNLKVKDFLWLAVGIALGVGICMLSPTQTTSDLWFIVVCGAIAICTMILPGISGSFILVILGKYDYIMGAVADLNWAVLAAFGIGCVVGILAFSKFLHWLLARFERPTLLVLIGFTLGALVKVWPWNGSEEVAASVASVAASTGGSGLQIVSAILWMIIGAVFVLALELLGKKRKA